MDREFAEMPGEGHLLIGGNALIAEDHDLMRVERGPDRRRLRRRNPGGQIGAADFRADIGLEPDDLQSGRVDVAVHLSRPSLGRPGPAA